MGRRSELIVSCSAHIFFDLQMKFCVRQDLISVGVPWSKRMGSVGLHCFSLPDTVPALVRVYVLAFENDPTKLMDYTDQRTQTRFVVAPPDAA